MLKRFFLSPDPADGGDPSDPNPQPANPPTPGPAPAEPPKPPQAAETVLNGDNTERAIELQERLSRREKELDDERQGRKKDQVRLSELEDENHRLKQVPASKAPASKPNNTFRWPSYNV